MDGVSKTSTGNIPGPETSAFVVPAWTAKKLIYWAVSQISIGVNGDLGHVSIA